MRGKRATERRKWHADISLSRQETKSQTEACVIISPGHKHGLRADRARMSVEGTLLSRNAGSGEGIKP